MKIIYFQNLFNQNVSDKIKNITNEHMNFRISYRKKGSTDLARLSLYELGVIV